MSDPTSPLRSGAAGVVLPPQPRPVRTLTPVDRPGPLDVTVTFKAPDTSRLRTGR